MMDPELVIQQREAEGPETYNAADNSSKCYALALRCIRLEKIGLWLIAPHQDDPEEMAAARRDTQPVMPRAHARSA